MKYILPFLLVAFMVIDASAARRSFRNGYPVSSRSASATGGLYAGEGALTPMEARLERSSGRDVRSTRIDNARKASRKIKQSIPEAELAGEGEKVRYTTISKNCPCETKTITATGGAKVGIGDTPAKAKAAATGNKAKW